ncbi:ATPase [Dissulfurirhabdus thermomarina]|uniref:ATPase n=1 Tax=Dissulfurirhabdus thermomarina TaxID=1765737 RepID=A0A6N9TP31_DISTH|nr:restriction endonuclease [Dissulfurirhabdus thermomarina]NDY41504.1 ATPase [Dissulfurirhabdus thermomarina]NMX23869.1 ATPase [Dissulfurirhabdus thermomarina]
MKPVTVQKSTGDVEAFDAEKLRASLLRSGADPATADEIVRRVLREVPPETSTKRIYRLARRHLNRLHHASGLRYSLKRALFRLGPTGYPFERYVGEIFRNYGYSVEVGALVEGRCVTHEVDVVAVDETRVYAMECKYHNTAARTSDVKVALYVHSRMRDLEPVLAARHPGRAFSGWLVTNTRCTGDAVRYAECAGLKIMGWRHPRNGSLERMIEAKRLYPVTIVSGIQRGLVDRLVQRRIILLRDLMELGVTDLMATLSLDERKAKALHRQVNELCRCDD